MDIDAILRRYEPKVARALIAAWQQLQGQVPVGAIADAMSSGVEAVLGLLSQVRLSDEQIRAVVEPLVDTMRATAVPAAATFNLRFDIPDRLAAEWAMNHAALVGEFLNTIPGAREAIRMITSQAFIIGRHPYESARLIRSTIGLRDDQITALGRYWDGLLQDSNVSAKMRAWLVDRRAGRMMTERARTIARTETIRAAQQGQIEGWKEAEVEGLLEPDRTWRVWSAIDDGSCDICPPMDGETVKYDEPWPSEVGGGFEAFAHVNCRCSQGLVFDLEPAG